MCSRSKLVKQSYRVELDPNEEQRVLLAKSVGASRYVYNWALAESKRIYSVRGKRPTVGELQSDLVGLKNTEAPWLYEVSAHIGQAALRDLNTAYDRFFKGLHSEGPRSGYPRFKRKGPGDSARLYEVSLQERHVQLPKIGRVRMKQTSQKRGIDGRVLSATIRRRADRWFVSFCVERHRQIVVPKPHERRSDTVGVDLGLLNAAVIYDGVRSHFIEPRHALRRNIAKLRRLNRQLARKQRGSANREKSKQRLARLYYRISCQRQDALHQLSSSLTKAKSVIVLEDLHVAGMQRNRRLALSVTDAAMGELRRQLTYKSEWYGSTLLVANRFFPSSKLCSHCGSLKDRLPLSERVYRCDACGVVLDRDDNAARNLRQLGLSIAELPVDRREVTPVERKALAPSVSRCETNLVEAGSDSARHEPRVSQKHAERRVRAVLRQAS